MDYSKLLRIFSDKITEANEIFVNEKLKELGFDRTKRGRVVSVNETICIVEIDGEEYNCKLRRGIYVEPSDIVFVKFPQDNSVDKYVDTILGGNETPENMVISAQEILDKLKTVDGEGSGLNADLLDGKHANEFATLDDLEDIDVDISGESIVANINTSQSIVDDKNLSENVNDAIDKKHGHTNKTIIDSITQNDIDAWDTVTNKADKEHTHTESDITDLDKYSKAEVDIKLNLKANESDIPVKLSELTKDINFDERYYTETESDAKYEPKNSNIQSHISNKSNPHNITKNQLNLGDVENKSSSTIRSEITDNNVINALGYTPENSANKGIANGYAPLDSNTKIPLSILPDIAKQQTYVVTTIADRDALSSIIMGEKCYITSTGDSYIWDGDSWEILAKADWENVNLQWTNVEGKPNSNVVDIDDAVNLRHTHSNKSIIDTITQTLIDRWNSAWEHISDTIKHVTSAERSKWNAVDNKADTTYVNSELSKKTNTGHTHTESDITNLDKYTKAETDTKLNGKVDKVTGKQLSTEDFTVIYKGKLDGIESGANNYTHPSSHPASMIIESTTKRFVADAEKITWNSKAEVSDIPTKVSQLQNDSNYVTQGELGDAGFGDMVKSIYDTNNSGVVDNAERVNGFTVGVNVPSNAKFTDTVYIHPGTHPYSMITGAPTSLPASGGQSDTTKGLIGDDTRNLNSPPSEYMNGGSRYIGRAGGQTEFKGTATIGVTSHLSGTYCYLETKNPWSDPSGGYPIQIAYGNGNPIWRIGTSNTTWSDWKPFSETLHVGVGAPSNRNIGWIDTSL